MKKVLIITYFWPPSGGVSVQRCLKFAKYLQNYGWEPIIYTAKNAQYPYLDTYNLKDIPSEITVLKRPIFEPFNIYKKISGREKNDSSNPVYVRDKSASLIDSFSIWVRGNLFIPDARCFWIKPSVRFLKNFLKSNYIDAIISNGPPHTNTVIANRISNKFGIPWLADFQDPWTQVDYYKMLKISRWADKKHKRMESKVFRESSKITIASPTWAHDLQNIGAKNVSPIYWGYDNDDFPDDFPIPDKCFSIIHAGLLGFDRLPSVFFKVLSDLINEVPEFKETLRLKFAGTIDYSVMEEIVNNNLQENLIQLGNVSRLIAIDLILKGHLLLLPLNKAENVEGRIPAKLFEYLRSERPILCLGPKKSDVQNIIFNSNSGEVFPYEDYDGIKGFIKNRFDLFLKGANYLQNNSYSEFNIEKQVEKLSIYLNEITDKN